MRCPRERDRTDEGLVAQDCLLASPKLEARAPAFGAHCLSSSSSGR